MQKQRPRRSVQLLAQATLICLAIVGVAVTFVPIEVAHRLGLASPAPPFEIALDDVVKRLPTDYDVTKRPFVAVNITPEGHYEFRNWNGVSYTAGTAAELARAPAVLIPRDATSFAEVEAILTTRSLFAGPDALKALPAFKHMRLAAGPANFSIERRPGSRFALRFGQVVALTLPGDLGALREAIAQLERQIPTRNMQVLSAFDSATPQASRPPLAPWTPAQGIPVVGADVDRLKETITDRARHTIMLSAKIEPGAASGYPAPQTNDTLRIEPPTGTIRSIALAPLLQAARASDTELMILDTSPPRQPGNPSWLYPKATSVDLAKLSEASRLRSILEPFAAARGGFDVEISFDPSGLIRLDARRQQKDEADWKIWWPTGFGIVADVAEKIAGDVKPDAIRVYLLPSDRQAELRPWLRFLSMMTSPEHWTVPLASVLMLSLIHYWRRIATAISGWRR